VARAASELVALLGVGSAPVTAPARSSTAGGFDPAASDFVSFEDLLRS
jgi:hypothetical protein